MTRAVPDVQETLGQAMEIPGVIGVALVDLHSGEVLGKAGRRGLDLDVAAAGNLRVLKTRLATMQQLGVSDDLVDITITLQSQYHFLRSLGPDRGVFLYLVLDRAQANLALARQSLQQIADGLAC